MSRGPGEHGGAAGAGAEPAAAALDSSSPGSDLPKLPVQNGRASPAARAGAGPAPVSLPARLESGRAGDQQQHKLCVSAEPFLPGPAEICPGELGSGVAQGPWHPAQVVSSLQGIAGTSTPLISMLNCKAVFNIFEMQLGFSLISYDFCAKACLQCCNCCFQNTFQLFPLYSLHLLSTFSVICSLPF